MLKFLESLTWWHWWIVAAVLAAAETFIPGALAIWFAGAALVLGMVLLAVPIRWELQLVLFGLLSVGVTMLWWRFGRSREEESTQPMLNQRGAQYIGRTFHLAEAIRDGSGKVEVGDSVWLVRGPDAPAGARVKVVGVSGTVLEVQNIQ
ncbi:MAG: NfeD family protein [Pseudomonadota bacterium]|nr:NfeD family protein [Pseudomonadota bacterium]